MNKLVKKKIVYYILNKKLFFTIVLGFSLIFIGCTTAPQKKLDILNGQEIIGIVNEVAGIFRYYEEIQILPNIIVGSLEVGGQCGDYALAFVNLWNEKYPGQALLVIQQQGLEPFPDGLYEVIGKDNRNLPIDWTVSGLYIWDGIGGIYHPELGNYTIRLVKELYIKSHFGIRNWGKNGPHVWVMVGNISVDPTYADVFPNLPVIGRDEW
jgi:hypothetical protein